MSEQLLPYDSACKNSMSKPEALPPISVSQLMARDNLPSLPVADMNSSLLIALGTPQCKSLILSSDALSKVHIACQTTAWEAHLIVYQSSNWRASS